MAANYTCAARNNHLVCFKCTYIELVIPHVIEVLCLFVCVDNTEDGRSMTAFYYYSVNHQSGLQRNIFMKL